MDFTLIFEAMIAQSPEAKLKLIANIEQMAQELLESENLPSNTLDSYYLESSFQTQEIQHFFTDFHFKTHHINDFALSPTLQKSAAQSISKACNPLLKYCILSCILNIVRLI